MGSTRRRRVPIKASIPSAAATLPEDRRNTAPETRARYRYQDECAAIALLNHLGSEDLEGVLVEHSTDLILLPVQGVPELVSIKHREPNQSGEAGWSWNALKRQRVLIDLYHAWNSAGRRCTLAFWTNGSFNGSTFRLWKVCTGQAEPSEDLLRSLTVHLGASRGDVEEFLAALTIPEDPLPRRKEATDVGVRRTAGLLKKHRPDSTRYAEDCYRMLLERIAKAGTDVPEAEALPRLTVAATLAASADRSQVRLLRRFLAADELFEELLSAYDRQAAASLPDAGQHGWEPDTQFIGRSDLLNNFDKLLRPGSPLKVAPVVIHGIPGCGKTSVAAQFAAAHKAILRPIFINASSRVALINDLAALIGSHDVSDWDKGIAQLHGPVTPRLPGNSATILIIDGVADADAIRGIIPRSSLCRVIITSTVSYLEQGYEHIELSGWSRAESHEFISTVLNETSQEDRERLAQALHDNPLALTQAVNYSRVTGRNIPDYLARLAREPLLVLDRGQASGHIGSIVKAIKINITAAEERFPGCTEILYLFSNLGSSPVDESLLDEDLVLTFVAEPNMQIPPAKRAWWPLGKRHDRQGETFRYTFTERGNDLFKHLCDHDWRDQAIEALLLTSLISRREEGLVVHPLVALVARKLAGDPRPWVEVGIGLFASGMGSVADLNLNHLDPHIDHLAALGSAALEADLRGPAVLAICQILSVRLSMLGTNHRYGDRTSVQFGQRAVEIAEKYLDTPWGSAHMLAEMRRALAIALWEAGHTDDAIIRLRQNFQLAHDYADESILLNAVLDLGLIVAEISQREVAEEVLGQLDAELERRSLDSSARMSMSIAHARARLLRRLGRIDEAKAVNEDALAVAEMSDCPDIILRELHGDAAVFARDLGDSAEAYRHEMAALEIVRSNVRDRPDIQDIRILVSAADGAIEIERLDEADAVISEAEQVARAEFGIDSTIYADVLRTRGRLRLHKREYKEALTDLERAATMLRDGSSFDRLKLPAVLVHLAQVAQLLGDRGKARLSIKEAYDIDLAVYGPDHPETRKDRKIMTDLKLFDQLSRNRNAWGIKREGH